MPYSRQKLLFDEWPDGDRKLWTNATNSAGILEESGLAAHWRPKTRHAVMAKYGLWLAYLSDRGQLNPILPPAARAKPDILFEYVKDLRARGLSPVTISNRVRDLHEALRVMQPAADLSRLNNLMQRLEAVAVPSRDKRIRVISPVVLWDAAIAELNRCNASPNRKSSRRTAERLRDALIIAFLSRRPIRLENLAAIELDRHLYRRGQVYWCRFSARETKDGQVLDFPLPEMFTPFLELYLSDYRPLLLRGVRSERLWISIRSTAMKDNSIYYRVTTVTKRLVGRPINPHLFRDCVATFIAEQVPAEVRIASRILGHSDLKTAQNYYNQAGMLSAQKKYFEALSHLRDENTVSA